MADIDGNVLAAAQPIACPERPAVDADQSRLDPALQARARMLRAEPGKRLVEAQSAEIRRYFQVQNFRRHFLVDGRW
ncbi:hypothetical protein D3C83_191320 [compost metagenome]